MHDQKELRRRVSKGAMRRAHVQRFGFIRVGFASLSPPYETTKAKEEGGRTPTNVFSTSAPVTARRALKAQRARLSAFHHGSCCGDRTPQLNSRYALPGTWCPRVLPVSDLSQSSELLADRSWCRPGVCPRSRPGAAVTNHRPREPLSLRQPASSDGVLHVSEILCTVTE